MFKAGWKVKMFKTAKEFTNKIEGRAMEIREEAQRFAGQMTTMEPAMPPEHALLHWYSREIASAQIACEHLQNQINELGGK